MPPATLPDSIRLAVDIGGTFTDVVLETPDNSYSAKVLTTKAAWAAHLRRTRHIGNFRAWKDHDAYQRTLERLLRDLRVETADAASG